MITLKLSKRRCSGAKTSGPTKNSTVAKANSGTNKAGSSKELFAFVNLKMFSRLDQV